MINYVKQMTLLSVFCMMTAFCSRAAEKPNILFIMSDDHTYQAIGAYGSHLATLNPTPNIDALAKGGMRFDRVFCNNSLCSPSRASILTGQYSQSNGVLTLHQAIGEKQQYLPLEMKKAGYHTAMIGKWHLKTEPVAFDHYCVLPDQGSYFNPKFRVRGKKEWPKNTIQKRGQHSSDAIADLGLEWLKNGWDRKKPFFMMHHFKAPHDMFQNATRYNKYLEDVEIPEPKNLFDPPAGSKGSKGFGSGVTRARDFWGLGRKLGLRKKLAEPEHGKAVYQKYLKRYLRCVKGVDDNVGRLVAYLKTENLLDNTVIIYTGDQGFFLGEHDLIDKRWMYEEAFRMPFIVHWPKGLKAGTSNDWLINNTDFAPTMLELAGVDKTPDYMQGYSFATALRGEAKPEGWRKVTYYRFWLHMYHGLRVPAHFGVRDERYKLIFFYGCMPEEIFETWALPKPPASKRCPPQTPVAWEFYDLKTDPTEMRNQYDNPEYAAIIARMKKQLKETREELNETDKKYPAVQAIIDKHWDDH